MPLGGSLYTCLQCDHQVSVRAGQPTAVCTSAQCAWAQQTVCITHKQRYARVPLGDGPTAPVSMVCTACVHGAAWLLAFFSPSPPPFPSLSSPESRMICPVPCRVHVQYAFTGLGGDWQASLLQLSIQEKLTDTCPACGTALGEPESFQACLALRCSHCPAVVCGFCYLYVGNWQGTHVRGFLSHVSQIVWWSVRVDADSYERFGGSPLWA
jgi:hypothetical protein